MIVVKFIDTKEIIKNLATVETSLSAKIAVEDHYGERIPPDSFYVDNDHNICFDASNGCKYVIENLIHWS